MLKFFRSGRPDAAHIVRQLRLVSALALVTSLFLISDTCNGSTTASKQTVIFQAPSKVMANPISRRAINRLGIATLSNPQIGTYVLKLHSSVNKQLAVKLLKTLPGVGFAESGVVFKAASIPNDPQYYLQPSLAQVNVERAWDLWKPQAVTVVAIVDTGITLDHEDLVSTIYRDNSNTPIMHNSIDNSSNANDDEGHGTSVAGIGFASINNGVGMAGIGGWNPAYAGSNSKIRVMPVKALNRFRVGTDTSIANGITWAVDHGANVINLCFSSQTYSATVDAACQYAIGKGCVVVAAAGNDGTSALEYPASNSGVISVGSIEADNSLIPFSNYGNRVNILAPGRSIVTTSWEGDYTLYSGTSASTPQVAATAAMILAEFPNASVSAVTSFITGSASSYTPYQGRTIASGSGRLNVYGAILAATQSSLVLCAAPSSLFGSGINHGAVLNWLPVVGAENYVVTRGLAITGPFTTIATVASGTTYTDTNLTNGTNYYYSVAGVNQAGTGSFSNIVDVVPQDPSKLPGVPYINFTSTWGTNVLLKWLGATQTASYVISRSTTSGGPYTVVYPAAYGPAFQDISVTSGATYYYVVQAKNPYGTSGYSNEVRVDVYAPQPVMPSGLSGTQFGRFAYLTWNSTARATGYNLYQATSPNGPFIQILSGIAGPAAVDTTVSRNGGTYYYQVQGTNANGAGPLSPTAAVTLTMTPPGKVQGIDISNRVRSKYLSWTGITMASSYSVKRSSTLSGTYSVIKTGLLGPAFEDTSANPFATYYYIVVAVNAGGNGPDSDPVGG